jgi:hypothetical protein
LRCNGESEHDLVARFAREHFVALAKERELSPFEKDAYTPVLRYACAQLDRAVIFLIMQRPMTEQSRPQVKISSSRTPGLSMRARGQKTFLPPTLSAFVSPSKKPPKCQVLLLRLLRSPQTLPSTRQRVQEFPKAFNE